MEQKEVALEHDGLFTGMSQGCTSLSFPGFHQFPILTLNWVHQGIIPIRSESSVSNYLRRLPPEVCFINLPGILNPTQLKVKINNITSVLKILHMKVRQLIGDCQNLWFTTRELQYNDFKKMYTKPDWVAQDNNLSFSGGQSWGLQIQSLPEDFLKWVQNRLCNLKLKR